jgi:ketosteroid isomerase-like protein
MRGGQPAAPRARKTVGMQRWVRGRREQSDIELAKAMFAAFIAQDAERMLALADGDISVAGAPIAERTGRSAPYIGREGLMELVRDLAKTWTDLHVMPREYIHVGGAVLVTATMTAHSQGGMLTGSVAWVYRVRRHKVVSVEVFRSRNDALAALDDW